MARSVSAILRDFAAAFVAVAAVCVVMSACRQKTPATPAVTTADAPVRSAGPQELPVAPTASAVQLGAPATLAATGPEATPPAVTRTAIATTAQPLACAAPSAKGLWIAQALPAHISVVDAPADWAGIRGDGQQIPTTAPARSLQCAAGGTALWVAADRGATLAVVTPAGVLRQATRANLLGFVAQSDGSAVLAAATGNPLKVELVRLNADLSPIWQREVAMPGAVTAVSATLRDDVVLIGRNAAGARASWWLARAGQRDGLLAWTRTLDTAAAPTQAILAAAVQSPTGLLLAFESAAPLSARQVTGWTLLQVDANGAIAKRSVLPQRAPQLVAGGSESAVIWAQTRGQGLILERADGYGPVQAVSAPWPSPELPLAIAVGRDGAWWAVSAASHAVDERATVLVTRFSSTAPTAAPAQDPACAAGWTVRSAAGSSEVSLPLQDGTPCGPAATCLAGQCRPSGR